LNPSFPEGNKDHNLDDKLSARISWEKKGAWEFGFRYSTIDLNDKRIEGGEESNVTLGITR
jgi:phosphate-selective porin